MAVDLYELLEISPHASQDVIQAAYRALVRKYHPDLNTGTAAAQQIRRLNAAYGVLSDRQGRARYDLECARGRRYERIAHPERGTVVTTPPRSRPSRSLQTRPIAIGRSAEGRVPRLNGQVLAVLLLIGALAAIVLAVLLAATFDPASEYRSPPPAPMIELNRP